MNELNNYQTPDSAGSFPARTFPTLYFYLRVTWVVFRAAANARKKQYTREKWIDDSCEIISILEKSGCRFKITGRENLAGDSSPRVFIANHMSTLETFALPCLLRSEPGLTYVVKKELIDYPVFRHVMRSRDPVVVGRENPREDFKTVMREGLSRLEQGISIILFPQTTRSNNFDPRFFNSMGIKLAKKAGVPAVPVAVKTDAWSAGKILKDFGSIKKDRPIRFAFAPPMQVTGNGKREHEKCLEFISGHITEWNKQTEQK